MNDVRKHSDAKERTPHTRKNPQEKALAAKPTARYSVISRKKRPGPQQTHSAYLKTGHSATLAGLALLSWDVEYSDRYLYPAGGDRALRPAPQPLLQLVSCN